MLAELLMSTAVWSTDVTQYCTPTDNKVIVGIAKSPAGKFLYCEEFSINSSTDYSIEYERDKKIFATKNLTYPQNASTPNVIQHDYRNGEIRHAEVKEAEVLLEYKQNESKKMTAAHIPLADVDVIDAGFDNFIRMHWDELKKGEPLNIRFASMSHLKVLPLRIRAQPVEQCDSTGDKALSECFVVEIDNALLRMLLGNIKLIYDDQHRLRKFDGVVNIVDEKGSTQNALIYYYHTTNNTNTHP